ncbi:MAG: hypothetical protein PHO15_04925 [Eubacteriales bacterium]|nr:hypothetical protein [Eubacteriales bacterium]
MENEKHGARFFRVLGGIVIGIFVAAFFSAVVGALVMVLWNWLMPGIFNLGQITYWQGFGLALIAKLLFGLPGMHKRPFEHDNHRHPGGRDWRIYVKHRMKNGTDRHFDDVYEDWWDKEGASSFEEYMKRETDKESE